MQPSRKEDRDGAENVHKKRSIKGTVGREAETGGGGWMEGKVGERVNTPARDNKIRHGTSGERGRAVD